MPVDTRVLIAVGVVSLFGIITFALAAATLGTLNKRFNALADQIQVVQQLVDNLVGDTTTTTTTTTATATTATTTTTSSGPTITESSTSTTSSQAG